MSRRIFLKGFLGLAGLALLRPAQAEEPRRILLQSSPVAGFQYHQGEALWPQLKEGQAVELQRRPDNPYDRRAVAVLWQGTPLGFLPKAENIAISTLLDHGQPLQARIRRLRYEADPWRRIEVEVSLLGGVA